MKLDRQGQIVIAGVSIEEYLGRLEKIGAELKSLDLDPLNPRFNSDLAAFVEFYSIYPKCTEPIRTLIRPPNYSCDLKRVYGGGEIRLMFSYIPDYPEDNRINRNHSKSWTLTPREIELFTAIPYNLPPPEQKEIVRFHGEPRLSASYESRIKEDIKGRRLPQLGFPRGTKLELNYELPVVPSPNLKDDIYEIE